MRMRIIKRANLRRDIVFSGGKINFRSSNIRRLRFGTHWLVIKSFQGQCYSVTANVVSLNSLMTVRMLSIYVELNALAF